MKLYIIAGEASGDLHASNLVYALKAVNSSIDVRGFGGDKMKAVGVDVVKHYKDLAFMGFWEVLVNLRTILRSLAFCKQDILQYKPDAVILVDYPGFNLRIAKFLKQQGIRVFYYISPQVWAWHTSRVKQIKKCVDRMFVILPFEKDFYSNWNYEVDFVGHPLLDAIEGFKLNENFLPSNHLEQKRIIAILPGSRRQEIKKMLPVMAQMAHEFPNYQFAIAGLSHIGEPFYRQYLSTPNVKLLFDQTYDLLQHSFAALVTSGTATLETALFNVPQVVCYKGNFFSYFIGRLMVEVKFIAMVNLICDKEVVKELIQHELTPTNLRAAAARILEEKERKSMLEDYKLLREKLGGTGASEKVARGMLQRLGILTFFFSLSLLFSCKNWQVSEVKPGMDDTTSIEPVKIDSASIITDLTKEVLTTIKNKNFKKLTDFIHPVSGLRFSPYAYIDTVNDARFTRNMFLEEIARQNKFNWGAYDGSGDTILLTIENYFSKFVYDHDFLNAEKLTLNKMIGGGNSLNNLEEVYKGCAYTESYFSGFDKKFEGMDWSCLRLVFQKHQDSFYLIGIVHDQWTT